MFPGFSHPECNTLTMTLPLKGVAGGDDDDGRRQLLGQGAEMGGGDEAGPSRGGRSGALMQLKSEDIP